MRRTYFQMAKDARDELAKELCPNAKVYGIGIDVGEHANKSYAKYTLVVMTLPMAGNFINEPKTFHKFKVVTRAVDK